MRLGDWLSTIMGLAAAFGLVFFVHWFIGKNKGNNEDNNDEQATATRKVIAYIELTPVSVVAASFVVNEILGVARAIRSGTPPAGVDLRLGSFFLLAVFGSMLCYALSIRLVSPTPPRRQRKKKQYGGKPGTDGD
jgi:hypothetical protein